MCVSVCVCGRGEGKEGKMTSMLGKQKGRLLEVDTCSQKESEEENRTSPNYPTVADFGYDTDNYLVSKVKEFISNDLLYLRSTCYPYGLWVLTSDPTPTPTPSAGDQIEKEFSATQNRNLIVKEKITNMLLNLGSSLSFGLDVLVQFWAPVTTGGRCFLGTLNQPFAISRYHEGLCALRRLSMDNKYYVDTTDEKVLNVIGRAFVQNSPRWCTILQSTNTLLAQCKVKGIAILPVLEPSSMDCVGVIEILSTAVNINMSLYHYTRSIRDLLQRVDLTLIYENDYNQNPEVASNQESVEKFSVEVVNSSTEKNFDTNQKETDLATQSPPGTENLLNGEGMVRHQVAVEDDTINNGNDAFSAGKSYITATDLVKEGEIKTTKREHRKNKISISYEVLKGYFGMKLEDAVEKLSVSRSTLKRLCRQNGVLRWPSHKRNKVNHPLFDQDPSSSNPPSGRAIKDGRTATIKATYRDDTIKFQLSFSADMINLEEEVGKRLKLETGTFKIKYVDGDGDWILIACDADLNNCLTSLGITAIKMLVEPVTLS